MLCLDTMLIVKPKLIKWNQKVQEIMRNRKNIGILFLMIATFLNPFGYAELFALVMNFTGDYWTTTYIFYVLAFLSFLVSFYLLRINPLKLAKEKIKSIFSKKDLKL